ncbi:MAG TPA: hypothetical protein VGO90_04920 [Chthoniobacteraceae bacterium]|jgi:hypothetical protein|nr:hypothetical protein [Chthoniobacteraceae bacterium]
MNPRGCATNLAQSMKDLSVAWQETKTHWRDVKAQEFDAAYIEILPPQVARVIAVMDEFDALFRKVRSDCE